MRRMQSCPEAPSGRQVARFAFIAALIMSAAAGQESKLVYAKDGSGVFGYKHTPVQPWSGYQVHDPDRPVPPLVRSARETGGPPSDAIVLFDGHDLSGWLPNQWKLGTGYVEATQGSLISRRRFGDCQIHLEWRTPDPPEGEIMNRGNSGVMLMGIFEIQIFDSTTKIYPDGMAAAIYGQSPPLVNASRKPGEWEAYDIVFFAPRFTGRKMDQPPRVTVFHNGVLVHHNREIYGQVAHASLPKPVPAGVTTGPLSLSGHHSPVRFRNIWVRELSQLDDTVRPLCPAGLPAATERASHRR